MQQWLSNPRGVSIFEEMEPKSRVSFFSSEQDTVVILASWALHLMQQSCTRKFCVISMIVGNKASIGGPRGGSLTDFRSESVTHCRTGEWSMRKILLGYPYFSSMTEPGSGDNASAAREIQGFNEVPTVCQRGSPEAPESGSLSAWEVCKEPTFVRRHTDNCGGFRA